MSSPRRRGNEIRRKKQVAQRCHSRAAAHGPSAHPKRMKIGFLTYSFINPDRSKTWNHFRYSRQIYFLRRREPRFLSAGVKGSPPGAGVLLLFRPLFAYQFRITPGGGGATCLLLPFSSLLVLCGPLLPVGWNSCERIPRPSLRQAQSLSSTVRRNRLDNGLLIDVRRILPQCDECFPVSKCWTNQVTSSVN
jgi:hypothetical protein